MPATRSADFSHLAMVTLVLDVTGLWGLMTATKSRFFSPQYLCLFFVGPENLNWAELSFSGNEGKSNFSIGFPRLAYFTRSVGIYSTPVDLNYLILISVVWTGHMT